MNCERFGELLIDFMEGEVDPSEREEVKNHLEYCPYCSKKLEDYMKIRRMFNEEALPQPSAQALSRLSKIAKDETERDKTPFWKKWFYSPILVPLLSSGLALLIWVSYGEKDIREYSSGTAMYSSRDVMAEKMPMKQKLNLPEVGERMARNMKSPPTAPLPESSSVSQQLSREMSRVQEVMPQPLHSEGMSADKDVEETDQSLRSLHHESSAKFEDKLASKPTPEKSVEEPLRSLGYIGPAEEDIEQSYVSAEQEARQDKEKINFNEKLNLALRQQKEGNCEASIKTNKELLNAFPPPPDSLKEKAYLSLAECYEQKGDWDVAIVNYKNLQEVAPEQTAFTKEKIEHLKRQNTLLKSRKLKSLGSTETEVGN